MENITSRQNPLFRTIRKLNTSNAFRRQQGLFVCEGPKLLDEAVKWGAPIETVVKVPEFDLPRGLTCRVVETPYDVLSSVTDTVTPQSVLFTCRLPDTTLPDKLKKGRYLMLDGVQDPGNMGTIWRTADALGAAGLILTGACGEPFAPKAVRSSMGACFRLPVWRGEHQAVAALGHPPLRHRSERRYRGCAAGGPLRRRRGHRQRGPGHLGGAAGAVREGPEDPHGGKV